MRSKRAIKYLTFLYYFAIFAEREAQSKILVGDPGPSKVPTKQQTDKTEK
jgi:hypothetical protein